MRRQDRELTPQEAIFLDKLKDIDTTNLNVSEIQALIKEHNREYILAKLREFAIPYRVNSKEETLFLETIQGIDTSTMTVADITALFDGKLKSQLIRQKLKKFNLPYKSPEIVSEREQLFLATIRGKDTSKMTGSQIHALFNGFLNKEYVWRQIAKHDVPYLRYCRAGTDIHARNRHTVQRVKVSRETREAQFDVTLNKLKEQGLPATWVSVAQIEGRTVSRVQFKYSQFKHKLTALKH
jgi:hypothetical protein